MRNLLSLLVIGALSSAALSCSDGPEDQAVTEQTRRAAEHLADSPGSDSAAVRAYAGPRDNGPTGACEFWTDAQGYHAEAYWDNFPVKNENGERAGFVYTWALNGSEELPGSTDEDGRGAALILEAGDAPTELTFRVTPLFDKDTLGDPLDVVCGTRRAVTP